MRKSLLSLLLVVGVLGAASSGAMAQGRQSFQKVPFTLAGASLPAHQGKALYAIKWRDRLGTNLVFLTKTAMKQSGGENGGRSVDLYAYHYLMSKDQGPWKLVWRTYDFIHDCPVDTVAEYLPGSLTVTDLNHNGIAETSFVYKLACRGDVSPSKLKLLMHEGATKYALRGESRVKVSDTDFAGGGMNFDAAFKNGPGAFREYAKEQWGKFVSETFN